MLRNLMSFNASADLTQVFFGGIYSVIGGSVRIVGSVSADDPHFPGARTGTFSLGMAGSNSAYEWCSQVFPDSQPTWTVGFAFNGVVNNLNTDLCWVMTGPGGSQASGFNEIQFGVGVNDDGSLYATYNNGTKTTSAGGLWVEGVWQYVEFSATCGASETLTVKLNGKTIITATGVNTNQFGTGVASCVALACLTGGLTGESQVYFNDVYICDGQPGTGSPNNTFLGPIHVPCAFPTANGFYSQFTPLANENWQEVSQYAFSDAAYVSTATAGVIDTYGFPAFPKGTVQGVQLNVIARKDYAGSRTLAPFYRGQSTDFPLTGDQLSIGNNYINVQAQFDGDPATGDAWTSDGLTAGQFGQEMVS